MTIGLMLFSYLYGLCMVKAIHAATTVPFINFED